MLKPPRDFRGIAVQLVRLNRLADIERERLALLVQKLVEHGHVAQLAAPWRDEIEPPRIARRDRDRNDRHAVAPRQRHQRSLPRALGHVVLVPVADAAGRKQKDGAFRGEGPRRHLQRHAAFRPRFFAFAPFDRYEHFAQPRRDAQRIAVGENRNVAARGFQHVEGGDGVGNAGRVAARHDEPACRRNIVHAAGLDIERQQVADEIEHAAA